jgi:hypothetical protein
MATVALAHEHPIGQRGQPRLHALADSPDAFGGTYEREAARDKAEWEARCSAHAASQHHHRAYGDCEPLLLTRRQRHSPLAAIRRLHVHRPSPEGRRTAAP